jgi:hexosaminidase
VVGQMGDSQSVNHYTTDGTDPTPKSPRAGRVFMINASTTVKARGFVGDKPVTRVVERSFEKLEPVKGVQTLKADAGLAYTAFEVADTIKSCAAITKGRKAGEGVAPEPSVAVKPREENFGLVFTGFLEVPTTGLYRFHLDSDDGSVMKLHGKVVVDNDGPHSATEKSAAIALEAGLHPIEIEMFEAAGQDLLRLSWQVPGSPKKSVVPASAFKH